jgi:hypothetical protein
MHMQKKNCYLEIVWLSLKAYFSSSSLWFEMNWQQKHTNSNCNISNCHPISFLQGLGPTHELAQQCLNLLTFIRLMGAITLMRTQAIVIDVWFCVSNILEKNKEFQMELLLHNVIFNVLVYIF